MEVALAIGGWVATMLFLGAVAVSAWRDSPKRGGGLLGLKTGSESSEGRVEGLLSTLTGSDALVRRYARGDEDAGLRLSVDGLCPSLTFWRPDHGRPRSAGDDWQPTGDPEFDRAIRVSGRRETVLALLPAATRGAIRDLLLGNVRLAQVSLERGTLSVEVPTAGFAREHPGLDQAAQGMAGVAILLRAPRDPVGVLTDNVAHDPTPGARLQSLLGLLQAHRNESRTRAALPGALRDSDELVRVEAALAAGAQGHQTLVALAVDPSTSDASAARAIAALGAHLPLDRSEPLVRDATYRPKVRTATTRAFISVLAGTHSDAAGSLLLQLARGAEDSFGPAVIDAMVADARPGAERLLIATIEDAILDRPRTIEAAARQLGAIGTADAVLPLKEAAKRYGISVASAAHKSVAAIQARIAASPGRLTLTDTEAGRLSKADDETGRVSLPEKDPQS